MSTRSMAKSTSGHKTVLAEHVEAIRSLGQTIANVIEIGRRLTECKGIVGQRNFGNWIDNEFDWAERTAQNFMRVYQLSKTESANFADLELPVSSLYLLAAPSTPESVRDEIIARAGGGVKIKHEEVQKAVAEARPARNLVRARNLRTAKLGADVMAKIAGTSLDRADEMDELVILNRGAAKGQLTPEVKQLVEDAAAGKNVSAIAVGGRRKEKVPAKSLRDPSEQDEAASLSPNIYFSATHEERQHFLDVIGVERLLGDMPAEMLAELHRRLVAQYRDQKSEVPLNPTEAALAQVRSESTAADDYPDFPEFFRRTKH
jgi:hypothetical protein